MRSNACFGHKKDVEEVGYNVIVGRFHKANFE